eukprot:354069-Chlamydomonas_euryale.AAC.7
MARRKGGGKGCVPSLAQILVIACASPSVMEAASGCQRATHRCTLGKGESIYAYKRERCSLGLRLSVVVPSGSRFHLWSIHIFIQIDVWPAVWEQAASATLLPESSRNKLAAHLQVCRRSAPTPAVPPRTAPLRLKPDASDASPADVAAAISDPREAAPG